MLVAVSVAWVETAIRAARPRSLPGPATVEEGASYPLRIRLERRRPPPPGGELDHPALERPLAIGPAGARELLAELRFSGWGRRTIEPPTLRVRDPLGLHERRVPAGAEQTVLVLPRVEPVLAPAWGEGGTATSRGRRLGTGAGGRSAQAIDPEIDGLRPWREGSPASRIHWPSVARTGELFERGLAGGTESSPLVVLDHSAGADREALAKALRAAASLCVHLARAGGCSLLLPGEGRPQGIDRELREWPRAHARLALIDPDRPVPARPPPGAGALFWVTPTAEGGSGGSPGAGAREGYLVTPVALAAGVPAFEVAGCHGYAAAPGARAAVAAARAG